MKKGTGKPADELRVEYGLADFGRLVRLRDRKASPRTARPPRVRRARRAG